MRDKYVGGETPKLGDIIQLVCERKPMSVRYKLFTNLSVKVSYDKTIRVNYLSKDHSKNLSLYANRFKLIKRGTSE